VGGQWAAKPSTPSTADRVVHAQPGYLAQKWFLEMHKSKRFLSNRKKARFYKVLQAIFRLFGVAIFCHARGNFLPRAWQCMMPRMAFLIATKRMGL
jgi:hypothetical protein